MLTLTVPRSLLERAETDLEAARIEISALKARLPTDTEPLPEWRLSGQLTILFRGLMAHRVATREILICALYPDPDDEPDDAENLLRVQIRKLRLTLRPLGVQVQNAWGQGYFFSASAKAQLKRLISQKSGE